MKTKLTIDIADILERKYPHGFHAPADIAIDTFLEFADDDWDHEIDLDALLAREGQVAVVWTTLDVHARRPDLTDDQAWEVLQRAKEDFLKEDCHLDFIESTADGLYCPPTEVLGRLRDRLHGVLQATDDPYAIKKAKEDLQRELQAAQSLVERV